MTRNNAPRSQFLQVRIDPELQARLERKKALGLNVSEWIRQAIVDRLDAEDEGAVDCPECGGEGCEWCRGTGVWRDPTPAACDGLAQMAGLEAEAGLPDQVQWLRRTSAYYRDVARRLRADADWTRRRREAEAK